MHVRKIAILLVYFLTVFLSLAVAKRYGAASEKRERAPSTFKTMMRYGRSGGSSGEIKEKVKIRPRADSFFLGPRYGKRSIWSSGSQHPSLVYPVASAPALCGLDEDLSCTYTGITDLYRCTPRKGNGHDDSTATSN